MESEKSPSKFQRVNVYNRFLPYASTCDKDADTFMGHLIFRFKTCLSGSKNDGGGGKNGGGRYEIQETDTNTVKHH